MFELNQLYNMDCMEGMKTFPDNYFDLAIVDPPYGINIAEWDKSTPNTEYFKELFRVSNNQIIWGGNYFKLNHIEAWICWDKTYKYNQKLEISEFELAWTSFNQKAKFIRLTYCGNFYGWDKPRAHYDREKTIHPTQKPVDLYRKLLIDYTKPDFKIIDTHAGSCSSVIAFLDYGCDWIAFEIDKDYYEAASKRIENHKMQLKLF